jgi:hypothetical protein
MLQIILLSLAACIAFNFLFVYVIDFKENILSYENEKNRKRSIVDKKDPFDVFVMCVILGPVATGCFILLWIGDIGIKICSCYEWLDAHVISKDDTVTTYTTEINFQNEEISQTTRPFMTKQGAEEVEKAKKVGDYPFSEMANSFTEKSAKEYKENNNNRGGRKNYNSGNGKKPHYNNKSSNDLVIPDPPYQGDKNSYRNKKRKKK